MDRDRRRREPDFQDQYGRGGGQSYRPGAAASTRDRSPLPSSAGPPRGGDSYRAARSPPPPRRPGDFAGDTYRVRPRSRSPPPRRDEYRRRSPTPPPRYRDERGARGGGDTYRAPQPPRSPVRREELPRDDLFRREPAEPRDFREEPRYGPPGRSPAPSRFQRERSPGLLKRGREVSPFAGARGGRRSPLPPPAKRERLASPVGLGRGRYDDYPPSRGVSPPRRRYTPDVRERRPSPPRGGGGYRPRSRSPMGRSDRVDPRAVDDWRRPPPRSPTPPRYAPRGADYMDVDQGRDSATTSRRSSPPVHPSRLASMQPPPGVDERSSRPAPRDPYDTREPYTRARSPEPIRRRDSPPPRRDFPDDRSYAPMDIDRVPPPREAYRADDAPASRAPPSGPAGYRAPPSSSSSMAPPSAPAAAPTVPVSAHARAPPVPPSGPRGSMGAPSVPRGDFGAPRGRGGFRGGFGAGFRGARGGGGGGGGPGNSSAAAPPFARADSFNNRESFSASDAATAGGGGGGGVPPMGPRGSFSSQPQPPPQQQQQQQGGPPAPPPLTFRQGSNTTATTYPRSQRFAPNGQPIPDGPAASSSSASTPPTGPRAARRADTFPTSSASSSNPLPTTTSNTTNTSAGASASAPLSPTSTRRPPAAAVHPALAALPHPLAGGKLASPPPAVDGARLGRLQEEAEKLRRQIEEREGRRRRGLREWERLAREVHVSGLRGELAEGSVRELNGEAVEGGAAF